MPGSFFRFIFKGFVVPALAGGLIVSCAGALPQISEEDARKAAEEWPGTTGSTLAEGRTLYIHRCAGCHPLHLPAEHSSEEWTGFVNKMAVRAKVTGPQKELILRFLQVSSAGGKRVAKGGN